MIDAPPNPEVNLMMSKRSHPLWHELATLEELSKIDQLDRSIANLRRRRQTLVNRAKLRTDVWLEQHGGTARRGRRKAATS
jgi:hypothetical protein